MTVLSITPKPTVSEEVRESVIGILEKAVNEAREGKITSVVVIALHPDGSWSDWQSATEEVSKVIGRLELAKQKRIKEYFAGEDD